jgi:hypothetical protein
MNNQDTQYIRIGVTPLYVNANSGELEYFSGGLVSDEYIQKIKDALMEKFQGKWGHGENGDILKQMDDFLRSSYPSGI